MNSKLFNLLSLWMRLFWSIVALPFRRCDGIYAAFFTINIGSIINIHEQLGAFKCVYLTGRRGCSRSASEFLLLLPRPQSKQRGNFYCRVIVSQRNCCRSKNIFIQSRLAARADLLHYPRTATEIFAVKEKLSRINIGCVSTHIAAGER